MARARLDLPRSIKDILHHVRPLPREAAVPIRHYRRTGTDIWGSLAYVEDALADGRRSRVAIENHLGRLYGMALIPLIETFERYLKEIASEVVDCLAPFVVDNRFNVFNNIQGAALASHFGTSTLGKSLCESAIWLDCEDINDRFRKLLANPFEAGNFYLFPKGGQSPEAERWRFEPMSIVWQLRHTAVHNVGVITQSDAIKLRALAREPVESPRLLAPTRQDLTYLKRFLDETAVACNTRIGTRLAELLTVLHAQAPLLILHVRILTPLPHVPVQIKQAPPVRRIRTDY